MASFYCLGTMPSCSEELTISVTGSLSLKAKTFSSLFGTPSGPGALLISILDSARQTRHLYTVGSGEAAGKIAGRSPVSMGGNEVQMEPKCLLIKLARSAAALASWPGRDTAGFIQAFQYSCISYFFLFLDHPPNFPSFFLKFLLFPIYSYFFHFTTLQDRFLKFYLICLPVYYCKFWHNLVQCQAGVVSSHCRLLAAWSLCLLGFASHILHMGSASHVLHMEHNVMI